MRILIFPLLTTSNLFGQPDTLKFSEMQHEKFQSILAKLDSMILRTDELNFNNISFDSLMLKVTQYESDYQYYNSKAAYQFAKEVYPNNCKFAYDENPISCGCIFNQYGFSRFKEKINIRYEMLLLLETDDTLELTKSQKRQLYIQEVNAILVYFKILLKFYNTDLQARTRVVEYFGKLQKIHLVVV